MVPDLFFEACVSEICLLQISGGIKISLFQYKSLPAVGGCFLLNFKQL
jgi:hypothetical protein